MLRGDDVFGGIRGPEGLREEDDEMADGDGGGHVRSSSDGKSGNNATRSTRNWQAI
jgi:hypothetical protein